MKECNKCHFVGHLNYFIKSKGYKDGHRDQRIKRGQELIDWTPKGLKEKEELNITPEGLELLINNGFARNREEALRYIQ